VDWFTLELHGYNDKELPLGIKESDIVYMLKGLEESVVAQTDEKAGKQGALADSLRFIYTKDFKPVNRGLPYGRAKSPERGVPYGSRRHRVG